MIYTPKPEDNHLLGALSPEVQERLFPHMRLVALDLRSALYEGDRPMREVYFPVNSIVSLQYLLSDGSSTALSVVGNEGLLGINWFLSEAALPRMAVVQSAGHAYRLPEAEVTKEFKRYGELMLLMLRYTQAMISQISQTAVCNRHHSVVQQLCRWMLISLDRLTNNHLTMTQEFIGNMIGVRRESVTNAARELQREGAIKYSRGLIEVIDRPRIEVLACECYHVVKAETDLVLDYLPHREVLKKTVPARHIALIR